MDSAEGAAAAPRTGIDRSLLEAKLTVPTPRPNTVSRADLIQTARDTGCRVVAATAPAGYGKTTLLAEWAAGEDRPVAWVSLDGFDDDPAALLFMLASAYERISPDDSGLIADMGGLGASTLGRSAPRLAAALGASPQPFVLMLDDLHEIRSSAGHDVLGIVIAGIPQGSQMVAASRSEQPHVPRLRVSGEVLELGPDALALDAAGARQIFSEANATLTEEMEASILERTEGWPAGLYLAALIAREGAGDSPTITGDDRYVADYLYRESLHQLPEGVRRFLRRTSVLDQLCAPLCDAVVGSPVASPRLQDLESMSLFVIPLDRRHEWYRYHALFREFLFGELQRVEPEHVPKLHLRAADWYESNGSPRLALEHLLQTGERERCVQLLTALILPTYSVGQMSTVEHWMRLLGDASIEEYPPLAVLAGWIALLTGQAIDAERWAAIVDAAAWDEVPLDSTASFASARAMLRAVMCANGAEQMVADATLAVREEAAWSPWRDTALVLLAEADLLAGDAEQAAPLFAESSSLGAALGNTDTIVLGGAELGLLAMDRQDWEEADGHLAPALATIDEHRMHDYVVSMLAFAGAARIALHRGDLAGTNQYLARAMRGRPSCTYAIPWLAVRVRLQLAKAYVALGDLATARHLAREIDDVLRQRPRLGVLVDDVSELRALLATSDAVALPGGAPLTPAEIRLLPYLQTQLTMPEIAGRLFVSHNTVRSQVTSIYRKFGVSSRTDAVEHATAIGLLGG